MKTIKTQVVEFCQDLDKVTSNRNSLIAQIATALAKIRNPRAKWAWVRVNVAEPIALHFKGRAVIRETRNGSLTFDEKGSEGVRHDAAYSRLRALVSSSELLSGSGNTNRSKVEKVSEREQVLEAYEALSAADRKWFRTKAGW